MTDRFETRLAAVLRHDADSAVRPIDAIAIAAIALRRPLRREWLGPLARVLAVAVLSGATLAGALLFGGSDDEAPTSTEGPRSSSQVDTVVGENGLLGGATTWAADVEAIPSIGHPGGRLRLVSGYGGLTAALRTPDDRLVLASNLELESVPANRLRLELIRDGAGCRAGDGATYHLSVSGDGVRLVVRPIDEACPARAAALTRTWTRTFLFDSAGGPGFIDVFDPTLRLSLPDGHWSGVTYPGYFGASRAEPASWLSVTRNPQGVTAPCADDGGLPVSIEPGAAAFEAYLENLPDVVVESSSLVVGGYPARHVMAASTRSADCPVDRSMLAWRLDTLPIHRLSGSLSGIDELYLVDVGDVTLLFTVGGMPAGTIFEGLHFQSGIGVPAPP